MGVRYKCVNGHDLCYGGVSAGKECPYCERITIWEEECSFCDDDCAYDIGCPKGD